MPTADDAVAATTASTHDALPAATDLRLHILQAQQAGNGLIVMVSLQGCAYCEVVRRDHLLPGLQQGQLAVVQVNMRSSALLKDVDGLLITHDAWVRERGVRIAPTLLFFGGQGEEGAERMVGAGLADFYGAYLTERLEQIRPASTIEPK